MAHIDIMNSISTRVNFSIHTATASKDRDWPYRKVRFTQG